MEISSSTTSEHFRVLLPYCLGLADPASNTANLVRARGMFDTVTPAETLVLVDAVMQTVEDMELVKTIVTRLLHSFTKALAAQHRPFERGFPFLEELMSRNDRITAILDSLKPQVVSMNSKNSPGLLRKDMVASLDRLSELTAHYTLKENILFPVIEKFVEENRCVQLMWAIHDDVRTTLKDLRESLADADTPLAVLNRQFGQLFFDMRSMVFREEQVLFPAILPRIPRNVLLTLSEDQHEEGQVDPTAARGSSDGRIDLVTGNPTARQLVHLFNSLPVDITLVDEDDKVVYFNTPEHRIFPRTKAVVGRTVQNCHPPKSVHIVQKILEAFRAGTQKEAEFRITVGSRYVRITYTALYHGDGSYAGTLEVSQDITGFRDMEGEKRLLDWQDR
ncbi:MAG: hypothetical protein CVV48_10280 [Spirochaetae bacterium HGW-Spirochaetae-4]|nr:MAG: hypothetical protein A2Y31_05265 [Spirochaetes bacterium GWC2_52_13]PKL11380.1 MAG: hypothetical protein CVV52_14080 [Spirochaetae bacterium HGW-Spirochaetae-8]PKL20953.1 MAG: hypothetical protein CVV48_10280 [Spirochaetae bacterium HGW-Spirochaetae-4]HCG62444.1 hypothetical protein [Sphaerochaeta sp.]HCS36469.1 hypothetical protein [Sphaerochaeta sp.]